MNIEELCRYLQMGEGLSVEFKRCGGKPENDTYETVCSFANRQGGNVFLGVGDGGEIIGVPQNAVRNLQRCVVNAVSNDKLFNIPPVIETEAIEVEGKWVIRVWVPAGPAVYSFKGAVFDRIADADVRVSGVDQMSLLYLRKQNEYSERRIYPFVTLDDFKAETIDFARRLAAAGSPGHPWEAMSDEELLRSAKLYAKDRRTGAEGYTLAAVLLFGKEESIADVCPSYKTDAVVRIDDANRYDDRLTVDCNLLEAYEKLVDFAKRHLQDRFVLEGGRRASARDVIIRELVANLLIHREFISPFPAKLIIEAGQIRTENASRSLFEGRLTLSDFNPISKNPNIAGVFKEVGYAEELGSGLRNLQKCSLEYSGKSVILEDGGIFKASVPTTPKAAARGAQGVYEAAKTLTSRDGMLTTATLSSYLGVTTRTAQRYVRDLQSKGLVKKVDGVSRGYEAT